MNGVPEYHKAKFKQTAKGIWYCEEIEVVKEKWSEIFDSLDPIMSSVEELLEMHNKEAKK